MLRVGDRAFTLSRWPPDGDLRMLAFPFAAGKYAALADGAETPVGYRCGKLDKSRVAVGQLRTCVATP